MFTCVGAAVVVDKSKERLMIRILTFTILSLNQLAQNMKNLEKHVCMIATKVLSILHLICTIARLDLDVSLEQLPISLSNVGLDKITNK